MRAGMPVYAVTVFCVLVQAGLSVLTKYLLGAVVYGSLIYYVMIGSFLAAQAGYAVLWQYVLSRLELSVANSMMSAVPLLTFAGGVVFFNEQVSSANVAGILMVISGLVMTALSKRTA